jgi:adenylylsulfate kinase
MPLEPTPDEVPVLLLTGPIGVGKTVVADEISLKLEAAGRHVSNIDVDALCQIFPRPADDPLAERLRFAVLRMLWPIHREAGAELLVLVALVESGATVARYRDALGEAAVTVVRLAASDEAIRMRLHHREQGSDLEWNLGRTAELQRSFETAPLQAIVIETSDRSVSEVAELVLRAAGW